MRLVAAYLIVGAALARGASAESSPVHEPDVSRGVFALVLEADRDVPPAVLREMKREFSQVLALTGYRFEWHMRDTVRLGDSFPNLAVFTIKGNCGLESDRLSVTQRAPLGFTAVADGDILPFSTFDCARIREALDPYIRSQAFGAGHFLIGRALGRVAAHELYHILSQTKVHGKEGLARETLTRSELMMPALRFDSDAINSLMGSGRTLQLESGSDGGS